MIARRTLLAAASLAPGVARAQAWPDRPVRILVGFPPGGAIDTMVRIIAPRLGEALGQPVIIENRPGAGSTIAMELGARAAPDGYTLVLGTMGTMVVNPVINRELSYNAYTDIVPIALVADVSNVLVVPPARPWRTLADLVAAAKAAPGRLSWGHPGVGTSGHLTGYLLDRMAGIRTESVGYRGGAQLATDLMAGRVDYAFSTVASVLPQIREGKLRPIAVPSATRQPWLAEVPTVAESGIHGFAALNWGGLAGPRGLPGAVIARLEAATREALSDPAVVETMARNGLAPMIGGAAEFQRQWDNDRERWDPVIRASGATVQ